MASLMLYAHSRWTPPMGGRCPTDAYQQLKSYFFKALTPNKPPALVQRTISTI